MKWFLDRLYFSFFCSLLRKECPGNSIFHQRKRHDYTLSNHVKLYRSCSSCVHYQIHPFLSIINFLKRELLYIPCLMVYGWWCFNPLIKSLALIEIIQEKQVREMGILDLNHSNNYFWRFVCTGRCFKNLKPMLLLFVILFHDKYKIFS